MAPRRRQPQDGPSAIHSGMSGQPGPRTSARGRDIQGTPPRPDMLCDAGGLDRIPPRRRGKAALAPLHTTVAPARRGHEDQGKGHSNRVRGERGKGGYVHRRASRRSMTLQRFEGRASNKNSLSPDRLRGEARIQGRRARGGHSLHASSRPRRAVASVRAGSRRARWACRRPSSSRISPHARACGDSP